MQIDPAFIDRIYEAAVVSDRWPEVLQYIADWAGAKGATIVMRSPRRADVLASTKAASDVADFIAQGWAADQESTAPLYTELWPGFRTETAFRTPAEITALLVHREFLDPRGYFAGAATVVQGTGDISIHMALDGFPAHPAAERAVPALDLLRPHLARAISLTALRGDRSQVVVDSLALAGVAAAVVSGEGRLRSANARFTARMADRMIEGRGVLRFTDRFLQARFAAALVRHRAQAGRVQSVAIPPEPDAAPLAIHIVPITGAARDHCAADGMLLLLAEAANAAMPDADLLRLMFDLTPAEARLTRHLLEGATVAAAAATLRITEGTARTHLRAIFAKTGTPRQSDLIRLLGGLGTAA